MEEGPEAARGGLERERLAACLAALARSQRRAGQAALPWWREWRALQALTAVRWARVRSVEPISYDHPHVYDLSVPGPQTFLSGRGGIFVHNTYTIANVIERVQRPAMVLVHNKTLAAQLYGEFREFFPHNAVEYFVSYYDYYQPEAYVPSSDTYIEKDSSVNEHIEQMRLSATKALLERADSIIVATVSSIYGLGDPQAYLSMVLHLVRGDRQDQRKLLRRLAEMQYTRNELDLTQGTYRVRGDVIDIFPAADRGGVTQGAALHGLSRHSLCHAPGAPDRRGRPDPRGSAPAPQGPARGRQAARGPAPGAAHHVRYGDDQGGRLLRRHRELLALSLRAQRR
jgi:hypothetical protein